MRIMTEGINWYYTLTGEGEPVLFLHGGLDTCVNYTRLLAELADRFSVIAVDRRGHGRTADTDAPFDCALVLCFSIGLAITLVSVGAAAAFSVRQATKRWSGLDTLARRAPYFSSVLIALVGIYMGYHGWLGITN
ncbi:alpha/beta fold hydrolase [Salmonella enterica]|nr:hypothetical protein [Salmonella enterica subsp. salamae]EEP0949119.1 alpha/beta fold hydrolase [Salmonella enterica]HCD0858731.1 alpha/beta fold hydrolase [Salmonella enterica subsp. enterica serovar Infantis]EEP0972894.1 alpha/beta fold hydrolase [Salmonella enterica]EEP1005377.1 alpha/beta fold hydrolase [Salmonella enterica]